MAHFFEDDEPSHRPTEAGVPQPVFLTPDDSVQQQQQQRHQSPQNNNVDRHYRFGQSEDWQKRSRGSRTKRSSSRRRRRSSSSKPLAKEMVRHVARAKFVASNENDDDAGNNKDPFFCTTKNVLGCWKLHFRISANKAKKRSERRRHRLIRASKKNKKNNSNNIDAPKQNENKNKNNGKKNANDKKKKKKKKQKVRPVAPSTDDKQRPLMQQVAAAADFAGRACKIQAKSNKKKKKQQDKTADKNNNKKRLKIKRAKKRIKAEKRALMQTLHQQALGAASDGGLDGDALEDSWTLTDF